MINLLIAGDFAPLLSEAPQVASGDFGFLSELKPIIQESDYAIVNFESPVVLSDRCPIEKNGPNICCHIKAMECIADAGFECVTLANNHFFDYGQYGVNDTLYACRKYNLDYVGGGVNVLEAQRILYKSIDSQRVAVINACENEFSIADNYRGGSNALDLIRMHQDIVTARNNADYVILILHGGIEHFQYPTPRMKRWYRYFVDLGADVVVNHHQHCINGYEVYRNKPIFYGLGNFYFPRKNKANYEQWKYGYLVRLTLDRQITFDVIPYSQDLQKVSLLNSSDLLRKIDNLNSVIQNEAILQSKFDEYIEDQKNVLQLGLLPTFLQCCLISALVRRGYLGRLYTGKQLLSLKNRVVCESHREVLCRLMDILKCTE